MAVTEVLQGLGEWNINLKPTTPKSVLDALHSFGHIAINSGQINAEHGDTLLTSSRYVGVFRGRASGNNFSLRGPGMAFWLGDEDNKGYVIETPLVVNHDFDDAVLLLLPPSVTPGTIHNVDPGVPFSYTFQYVSRREALNYLCETKGCEWRINGDGSVDAGTEVDLFRVVPNAALVRKRAGTDLFLRAFRGTMSTEEDYKDFTTRTVLLANGSEGATVTATADIDPAKNPWKDLFGNPVKLTRLISESDTDATNAPARAQLQLNRFTDPSRAITLSTQEYDLKGSVAVGDYLWVYDNEIGITDNANEVMFRGELMYPMKLRLTELTWAVTREMGVAFRDNDGNWIDLSPYIIPEDGESSLTVGGYYRALSGGDGGSVGSRPIQDNSVPAAPTWVEASFAQSVYQSAQRGESRAQIQLVWTKPNNVDGSTILDGDHYEIRYRSASSPIYTSTHAQLAARTHAQLNAGTHAQPIVYPVGNWQTLFVPFSDLSALIIDLPTNMPYEAQIRAVDAAKPPNAGAWSTLTVWQTRRDTIAPQTPAPPSIAAGTLNVKVTHTLGAASGGTYNLATDLHHFEVHGGTEPLFTPTASTLLGKILANAGMITGQVPLVGVVPIEAVVPVYYKVIAVDDDGNKSSPSTAVQATALLVDDAHIANLSVGKVTAGTMTASWIVAGSIKTGNTGARVELNASGVQGYNSSNVLTSSIKSSDGSFEGLGSLISGTTGKRIEVNPVVSAVPIPEVRFFPSSGSSYAYINAPGVGESIATLGLNSGPSGSFQSTLWLWPQHADLHYTNVGTGTTAGGRVHVDATSATMESMNTSSVRNGGFFWARNTDAWWGISYPDGRDAWMIIDGDGNFGFKGTLSKGQPHGAGAAFWHNYSVSSGGAVAFAYGATMVGAIVVLATWTDYVGYSNTTICNVYNTGATGFNVGNGIGGRNGHYTVQAQRFLS
jgi:hypothetical protein